MADRNATQKTAYVVPTLESLSKGQVEAIRSIPAHDEIDPPAIKASRPASIFLDDARFQHEQQRIFKRLPVPVTVASMLPKPGQVLAHNAYGVPLLLSRDRDGVVRAFLNVCQHKGAMLVEDEEPHRANLLTCPYHAWSYGLDGNLIAVAREEVFEGLCKSGRGLVELACREAAGLIWVHLDRDAEPDFSGVTDELCEDLDALGIGNSHVYGRKRFEVGANWKLVLEPFLEGYHVQRLHAKSIGRLFADVPNVTHRLGPHIRQISGKAHFEPTALDVPGENIHKTVTHAYQVFPNTVIVTSPYYISVMIIIPKSAGTSTVDYFMLTQVPPDNDKARELYARSYEMVLNVFGNEDYRAAEISQRGLASGGLDKLVYGGLEETIPMYYEYLESCL